MRSFFITDIHNGYDVPGKRFGAQAIPLLREHFLSYVDAPDSDPVDLIINGGDETTRGDLKTDLEKRLQLRDIWEAVNPRIAQAHILGNYEVKNLSWAENEEFYGHAFRTHSIDVGGIRHLIWMADVEKEGLDFTISDKNLSDLKDHIDASPHDVIVYHHFPLTNTPEEIARIEREDNVNPHWYLYRNGEDAQKIIVDSGKVVADMGGHRHRFEHLQMGRTHFLTIPSFTQSDESDAPQPAASFAECRTSSNNLEITIHGRIHPDARTAHILRHIELK